LETRFIAADELDSLIVFVNYHTMNKAFELVKRGGHFARIIKTPEAVFAATSLSIAVRNCDLESIQSKFEKEQIIPIKTVTLKRCALDYLFNSY
jgi:hypothetical protein